MKKMYQDAYILERRKLHKCKEMLRMCRNNNYKNSCVVTCMMEYIKEKDNTLWESDFYGFDEQPPDIGTHSNYS